VRVSRNIGYLVLFVLSVLLFTEHPFNESERTYKAFWNTGHLYFFAILIWLVLQHPALQHKSVFRLLAMSVLISLISGGMIEVIQLAVGRDMDIGDVLLDVLGGLLGCLIILLQTVAFKVWQKRLALLAVMLVLLLAYIPFLILVYDDYLIKNNFPVIADFESTFEKSRWYGVNVQSLSIDDTTVRSGEHSLKSEFALGEFPALELEGFTDDDWSEYQWFKLSLFNDQPEPVEVEIKVYDRQHQANNYRYSDRFNRVLRLQQGWNDFAVPVNEILNAPEGRRMDPTEIYEFSIFLYKPIKPLVLYVDDIYLSHEK